MPKKVRGQSAASKEAAQYLKRNPDASISELAQKFKISASTVSRADWWRNRAKASSNV